MNWLRIKENCRRLRQWLARRRYYRWITALCLAASALTLIYIFGAFAASDQYPLCCLDENTSTQMRFGEALIHGISGVHVSWSMPLPGVINALLCHHGGAGILLLARGCLPLALCFFVFGLGRLLHSSLAGGIAVLFLSWIATGQVELSYSRWFYALLVLISAYCAVLRARFGSMRRSILLGLAIGLTLLDLSTLFLYPLALIAYERFRSSPQGRGRTDWLLLALPAIFLIPWIFMNWQLQGGVIPFESGRANRNLLAGAMGEVFAGMGDYARLAGLQHGDSVYWWAAKEILRHPLRYAGAYWARFWYVLGLYPVLSVISVAAAWTFRRRKEFVPVLILAAYFIFILCTMAVKETYFQPLWPILCVLAASLVAEFLKGAPDGVSDHLHVRLMGVTFIPLLIMSFYTLSLVGNYASRSRSPEEAFQRGLDRHPRDSWLLSMQGMRSLEQGRADESLRFLAKALALDSQEAQRLKYAFALVVRGGPAQHILDRVHIGGDTISRQYTDAWVARLKTLYYLQLGRTSDAREALVRALSIHHNVTIFVATEDSRVSNSEMLSRLRVVDTDMPRDFLAMLNYWPRSRRLDLLGKLNDIFPRSEFIKEIKELERAHEGP